MAEIGTFQTGTACFCIWTDTISEQKAAAEPAGMHGGRNGHADRLHHREPYFYIYNALLSRATVFEFKPLTPEDVRRGLENALHKLEELDGVRIEAQPRRWTRWRRPAAATCARPGQPGVCRGGRRETDGAKRLTNRGRAPGGAALQPTLRQKRRHALRLHLGAAEKHSRLGPGRRRALSGAHSGSRGSAVGLRRLLSSRRRTWALRTRRPFHREGLRGQRLQLGLPEARLPLADAAVLMATAPKSNSAHNAILAAEQDLRRGKTGPVPRQLQNKHFDGEDAAQKGQNYLYPHDYPGHWVKQQYLPDALAGVRYYEYGQNKNEQAAKAYWDKIKK